MLDDVATGEFDATPGSNVDGKTVGEREDVEIGGSETFDSTGGGVKVVGPPVGNGVSADVGLNVGIDPSEGEELGDSLVEIEVGASLGAYEGTYEGTLVAAVGVSVSVKFVGLDEGVELGMDEFVGRGVIVGPTEIEG